MFSRTSHRVITSRTAAFASAILAAGVALAVPINGQYIEDARCDTVPNTNLTHELGDQLVFPPNEGILYSVQATNAVICVPQDGNPNDWIVRMINTSGTAWQDLFFVCDFGATVGNADGTVQDMSNAASPPTDAFRIDGTVTPGMNANLLSESMVPDEIFAPGEIWEFMVSNFNVGTAFMPPQFVTPGFFAGTSNVFSGSPGNASILANPVPEPTSFALIAVGAMVAMCRRRRKH